MTNKHTLFNGLENDIESTREKYSGPVKKPARSAAAGLYDPANEHDACGLGFIANMKGKKSHKIIEDGIRILENLEHRGATGADPLMGDGAGMLVQIPHEFYVQECSILGFELPAVGDYGLGYFFMPRDETAQAKIKSIIERSANMEGLSVIGWRAVPVDNSMLSQDPEIQASEPSHWQCFFSRPDGAATMTDEQFDRKLFVMRRVITNTVAADNADTEVYYAVSLDRKSVV